VKTLETRVWHGDAVEGVWLAEETAEQRESVAPFFGGFDAKKKKDLKRRGELAKFLAAARLRGGLGAPNSASVHSLFAPVLCLDGFALMSCRCIGGGGEEQSHESRVARVPMCSSRKKTCKRKRGRRRGGAAARAGKKTHVSAAFSNSLALARSRSPLSLSRSLSTHPLPSLSASSPSTREPTSSRPSSPSPQR